MATMKIIKHPTSEKLFIRLCLILFLSFTTAIVLPLALAHYGFDRLMNRIGIYYVCGVFLLFIGWFIRLYYSLYHLSCPKCGGRTVTRRSSPESPYVWSATCKRCDILWDLGIGNSPDGNRHG